MMSPNTAELPGRENRSELDLRFVPPREGTPAVAAGESVQRILFRLADTVCSLLAFLLAYAILPQAKNLLSATLLHYPMLDVILSPAAHGSGLPSRGELWWVCVVVTIAMALTLEYTGDSKPLYFRSRWGVARMLLLALAVGMAAIATIFFALRVPAYSRIFLSSYIVILFVLAAGYRLLVQAVQVKRHNSQAAAPQVLLAGSPTGVERFLAKISNASKGFGGNIAGCLLAGSCGGIDAPGVDLLGEIRDLGELLIHQHIDEVVVILPDGPAPWLPAVLGHCDYFRVSVQIVHESLLDHELRDLRALDPKYSVPSIRLIPDEQLTTPVFVWKRALDVILSLFALIMLAPLMALIAAAIKITTPSLPVFYPWNVVGCRGRRFTGYKFTTMVADADDRKAELSAQNEMSGPVFKIRNDPRVTPLGKFLRKYSLNELPQFWSVLTGDMSLVGPRPAGPHELVRYEMWQKRKLSVQPGITCFWQVRGRNAITSFDDWVRMDLEYIQKRGFWTDVSILLRTVTAVIRGTGC